VILSHLERMADASFELPRGELVTINRWLQIKTCLTIIFALLFAIVLRAVAIPDLPVTRIAVVGTIGAGLTVPFRRWLRSERALGLLIYAQFAADVTLLAIAFSLVPELPVIFHLQLLLVVVPCALLSRQCGVAMAGLSSVAHLALCALRTPAPTLAEVLAPVYFFWVVGHQCLYYGRRLAQKSREAERASRVTTALLRAARELPRAPTSAVLLQRLAELARATTGAEWAAVLLRDAERCTFRVAGLVSRTGFIDEEVKSIDLPEAGLLQAAETSRSSGTFEVKGIEDSFLPAWLHERWRIGRFLASPLQGDDEVAGIVAIGPCLSGGFPEESRRVLVGLARQAVLALENARLLDDVKEASALKSEFIGAISHELRSPLHAIVGYTEMLLDERLTPGDPDAERRQSMLRRIDRHARQLHELISATLDLSRLEGGRLPLEKQPVDLAILIDEIRRGLPEHWQKPGVALEWRLWPPLATVETDPRKLAIVVRNLVENALKFTDAGRVVVDVALRGDGALSGPVPGGTTVCRVDVSDTDIGIPEASLATIFEMFRQLDGSDSRRHDGVGLGLYLVKRLVSALGGAVHVESEPGRGSRFEVALPVLVVARGSSVGDAAAEDGAVTGDRRLRA
jgi:signal transduction histidine kinase